jgi:hypothetical protein
MQELWVFLYAGGGIVTILTIIKGFRAIYSNWKREILKKELHADKRKNGKAGHPH